jgi:squalene-associated FAD-dependent desaturase
MTARGAGAPDAVVIGAGFAGLAAATALAAAGARVAVLEGRPHVGGRARSWTDPTTGSVVDNGQHLLLGCCTEALAFLDRLGTRDRLAMQARAEIPLVDAGGRLGFFRQPRVPGAIAAIGALLRYPGLGLRDRLALVRAAAAITRSRDDQALEAQTVAAWLASLGQSSESRRRFWDPLALAVLNEDPEVASVAGLAAVLRLAAQAGAGGAVVGLARVGLSDLYADPAVHWLRARGGDVRTRCPARRLLIAGDRVSGVLLADGGRIDTGAVIVAVPPREMLDLLPPALAEERHFARCGGLAETAIVSVYLWFGSPVSEVPFAGLVGGTWHWMFNRRMIAGDGSGAHAVTLVRSAAGDLAGKPAETLARSALDDLRRFFPETARLTPRRTLVLKERRATVSLPPGAAALRPPHATPLRGVWLAGDWTATGLPATLESAAASGHACARLATAGGV